MVIVAAPVTAGAAEGDDQAAEGLRLRREGKDQAALPVFEAVVRDQPSPRAYAQLGICEQALGLWVPAEEHLQQALKTTRDAWIQRHQRSLRDALSFVRGRIGSVEVWGTPPGAEVSIDGQVVGRLPLSNALRVAQGSRILKITADSYLAHTRSIDVTAGGLSREHVALVEDATAKAVSAAPATVPPAAPVTKASAKTPPAAIPVEGTSDTGEAGVDLPTWRRVLPWSLLGAAVVAGSFGLWEQLRSNNSQQAFDATRGCGATVPNYGTDGSCSVLYHQFSSQQKGAYVGYGIGAALGIGAATLFIVNANASSAPHGAQAQIFGGPGSAGLSISTAF